MPNAQHSNAQKNSAQKNNAQKNSAHNSTSQNSPTSHLLWTYAWQQNTTPPTSPAKPPVRPLANPTNASHKKNTRAIALALQAQKNALPFISMDYEDELITQLKELTPFFENFEHLLLLGIGGSALGARALQKSFYPQANLPLHGERGNAKHLWIADNIDVESMEAFFARLPPSKTLVMVISKSGGTIETASQYFLAKAWLQKNLADTWHKHLLIITDKEKGFLRKEADLYSIASLPVPTHLGGRYSVLCAVGLAPAAFLGIDWEALLRGARTVCSLINLNSPLEELENALLVHPAFSMAEWGYGLMESGFSELIHFTYAPALAAFGPWFAQLWAESLGKNGKGSMPVPAVGVTDQHSLQQMFLDGPRNKGCLFISAGGMSAGPSFGEGLPEEWTFLNNLALGNLLEAEKIGTKMAMVSQNIPLLELHLAEVNEYCAGQMIALLGLFTIFTGYLMGIDPLDQPAVELGKRLANAALGKGLGSSELKEEHSLLQTFANQKQKIQEV